MAKNCFICGNQYNVTCDYQYDKYYYDCPMCGRYVCENVSTLFFKDYLGNEVYDKNKLMSYLFYHKAEESLSYLGTKESYKKYVEEDSNRTAKLVTQSSIDAWYPKTFADKIDLILLKLAEVSNFSGDYINIDGVKTRLFFIVDKKSKAIKDGFEKSVQVDFIFDYLVKQQLLIDLKNDFIQLSPKGWERVYELQKTQSNNKNVFVAMKFGVETKELREKIKEGLTGYKVRIMDEIEHNHQIVPEMLYEIKNSRFVVAELSHHNNGAYYEAGYALGLGKEVIHICSEQELKSGLHFDVAQINTITYKDINEIPEKLKKRIRATIENK